MDINPIQTTYFFYINNRYDINIIKFIMKLTFFLLNIK
jgi:hypothetical protein